MSGKRKRLAATLSGIILALAFVFAGLIIPKALLAKQENEYIGKREMNGSPTVPAEAPIPSATRPPRLFHSLGPAELHSLVGLLDDYRMGELALREPYASELSMEEAADRALDELSALIGYGAVPDLGTARLRLRSAELHGIGSYRRETDGWPSGLWLLTFEDISGDEKCSIACDSQTGLIFSISFGAEIGGLSAADCYSMLMHYAEYFGLSGYGFICNHGDAYYAECSGIVFSLRTLADRCELRLFSIDPSVPLPTNTPTVYPTPAPTATPTPAPAFVVTPATTTAPPTPATTPVPGATFTPDPAQTP